MLPIPAQECWRSRTTFVLALAIATIGLGNLWRFSWLMGEHGGAPFVLSYVFCLLVVGVPLLSAEIVLGTHGRGSPLSSTRWAIMASGRSSFWLLIPLLTCLAAVLLLVVCIVVGGWALLYAFHQQLGTFAAMPAAGVSDFLGAQLDSPSSLIGTQAVLALFVALIGAVGVRRGLGLYAWISVPVLLWLLGVLVNYALEFGDLEAAGRFLFARQPLDFDGGSFLAALGHALFTLSIGVAVGMSFGAYAPRKLPVLRSVIAVALFDLVVAVAAGLALYPLLAEANVVPAREFALLFLAVPFAYGGLPFGDFYGALFFLMVAVVLVGSAAALLEPVLGVLEQQFNLPRRAGAPTLMVMAWSASCFVTLGLGDEGGLMRGMNLWTSQLLMPLAMLLLALFVAWRLPRTLLRRELGREPEALFSLWYFLLRFVAPPVIGVAWLWLYLVPQTQ
ncbi:MAG: sodium-dependent transporter [Pseudomonadota bacterium]